MKRLPGVTLSPFALGETGMVQDPVTMLIAIDSSRGLSPSQTIGGVPKKRGCQAPFESATPPPPTKTVGGEGQISREKCRFLVLEAVIWRRGPPVGRVCV